MIDQTTLYLFLATVLVFVFTPGPNMIFCVARALGSGARAGILSAAGVCIGLTIHATAAGLGLSQLFKYFPVAYDVLKIGGAIYLLWLAWQSYKASSDIKMDIEDEKGEARNLPKKNVRYVVQGAVNALLSPKAVFFYLILFPQFLDPTQGSVLGQSLILITIINVINFSVIATLCIGISGSSQWLFENPAFLVWQRRLVSLVFVGLAARVVTTKATP